MKEVKKKKHKYIGIIRMALLIICGIVIGVNVYHINAKSFVREQLPMPMGFGMAIVLSGSMEPELSAGDLIIVKATDQFTVRDVVVYQDGESLVVHRIVDVNEDTITTKGDANNVADEPISSDAIKGKVALVFPAVGRIVGAIKTPIGTICMIVIAIALVEIPRRREKQKDDEERQKIIDEIKRLKDE